MKKHDSLEKDIIMGTLTLYQANKRARGRPKTSWMNNITARTGLTMNVSLRKTEERSEWRAVAYLGGALVRGPPPFGRTAMIFLKTNFHA